MGVTPQQFLDMQRRVSKPTPAIGREIKGKIERELKLHDDIIRYCNAQWPRWKYIHARTDQRPTIAVGCQDFTIFAPGRVLCIECKRADGKPDHDQLIWHKEMEMLGHTVHIVRSLSEFLEVAR
jgi:hypothetical protein